MKVKTEGTRFCLSTSVKGVSRIFKSEFKFLRYMWFFTILLCFCVAVYQTWLLMEEYLEFKKVTTIYEKVLTPSMLTSSVYPALTVCNIVPMVTNMSVYQEHGIPTWAQYKEIVDAYLPCPGPCPAEMQTLRSTLKTYKGYYEYIGVNASKIIGHSFKSLIIGCKLHLFTGYSTVKYDCPGDIIQVSDPDHFNCYTFFFKSDSYQPGFVVNGITLVVHLGQKDGTATHFIVGGDKEQSIGADLYLHSSDKIPVMWQPFANLAPGEHSFVSVRIEKRIRLPPPYENCVYSNDMKDKWHYYGYPKVNYSPSACISSCFEEHIMEKCNCLDSSTALLKSWEKPDLNFCHSLKHFNPIEIGKNMRCIFDLIISLNSSCSDNCNLECEAVYYPATLVTEVAWPRSSQAASFYEEVLEGLPGMDVYKPSLHTGESLAELLSSNFAKVTIYLGHNEYFEVVDEPSMTPTRLLSSVGGILNLWSGITVIFAVEFLEFIFRLIKTPNDKENAVQPLEKKQPCLDKENAVQPFRNKHPWDKNKQTASHI